MGEIFLNIVRIPSFMELIDRFRKEFLFQQQRVGQYGKGFTLYKFRSMKKDSEQRYDEVAEKIGLENVGNPRYDPRITKVGEYLRKTKIDELPQFFNLFKGDVKLIGLRPITEDFLKYLPKHHAEYRMLHKPGLFPVAKNSKSIDEFVQDEARYMRDYDASEHKFLADLRYGLRYFCSHEKRKPGQGPLSRLWYYLSPAE